MRRLFVVLAALFVMAPATILCAAAADPVQMPGANLTVTTCHAQLDPPPLRIAYVNNAPSEASEVDFDIVTTAGTIETVKDSGHFASGQPINHVFALPSGVSPLGLSSAS